ncbi:MAG: lipopolysaccharide biosynthesis protein [Planctomycetales bacterium]|nr:lipopolysaccharide biosynthesis protein [Planctomycetales bacterium]
MQSPISGSLPATSNKTHAGDYLLSGVLVMLAVNVLQRGVGLLRGLGVCQLLSEEQLGHWSLTNSLFVIGAPIAVLGLPGCFTKFTEYFRNRAQLGDFLLHTLRLSALGVLLTVGLVGFFPSQFSQAVFGETLLARQLLWVVCALVATILFNTTFELVASLRHVRVASSMQFVHSLTFTVVGLGSLWLDGQWERLLPSYCFACLLGMIPGLWAVRWQHSHELRPSGSLSVTQMLGRVAGFAVALWVMNLLSNLFEVSDRYMLLHLTSGGPKAGQAAVGQYHCCRIVPNLWVSLGLTLSGILLPYLSADWERGALTQVSDRVRQTLQSTIIGLTVCSIVALIFAPLLFDGVYQGRYEAAREILPISLVQAIWVACFLVSETYLMCAERVKQLALLLLFGLVLNLVLNYFLIQQMGLPGAVIATCLANLACLLFLYRKIATLQRQHRARTLGRGTWLLTLLPVGLMLGPIVATLVLAVFVIICGRTEVIMTSADRKRMDELILPKLTQFGIKIPSIW